MRRIAFHKVHGTGNDFILVDAIDEQAWAVDLSWNAVARAWCDRHTGIGADGVLVVSRASDADCAMRIINSDGSDGAMCGNGIRCVARHLVTRRGNPGPGLRVRTARGVQAVRVGRGAGDGGGAFEATVDMGAPVLTAGQVPVAGDGIDPAGRVVAMPVRGELAEVLARAPEGAGVEAAVTCVSMGNPHAVVFCRDVARVPLVELGPGIERCGMFPERTNVHFVQAGNRGRATMRTWERGAGATRACGTGACAALVAGVVAGRLDRAVAMALPGGELRVAWDEGTDQVAMTGSAEEVFRGTVDVP